MKRNIRMIEINGVAFHIETA